MAQQRRAPTSVRRKAHSAGIIWPFPPALMEKLSWWEWWRWGMGSAIEIPTHRGCSTYSPCESPPCWPQRWTLSPEYNTTFHRDQLSHLTEHWRHWTKSIIESFMETNKLISKICMDDYRTMKPKLLLRKNKKEGCALPDNKIKLTKIVWYQCRNIQIVWWNRRQSPETQRHIWKLDL